LNQRGKNYLNSYLLKAIALIDLYSGGHRNAFMCLFAKACLENNVKVFCFYPQSNEIKDWIEINAKGYLDRIIFIDYQPIFGSFTKLGRFNTALSILTYWKNCALLLKKTEIQYQIKIDLVYFNWLDSQMANYLPPSLLDFIFSYKWSGLYFHPNIFRITPKYLEKKATFRDVDSVFLSKKCVAITLHDEGIIEKYQNRINKKTLLFPEIADNTAPNSNNFLARKIKDKANGRTIIGIIGLEPYKGTLSLIRLVKIADASKYFFAFTGVFNEDFLISSTKHEQNEIKDFIKNVPENCIWQTGSLQEGEEYNSIFCSFDIVYIIYKNFFSSSNRLTKAAIFNRLVLANNNGCVGDDVPKYNLGETADENDIKAQYQKLEILREQILAKDFPYNQWKIYAEKHGTERLKEKFEELLNLV
jgi:hypothetical protein